MCRGGASPEWGAGAGECVGVAAMTAAEYRAWVWMEASRAHEGLRGNGPVNRNGLMARASVLEEEPARFVARCPDTPVRTRLQSYLEWSRCRTVGELVQLTPKALLRTKNLGLVSVAVLETALAAEGLRLGMDRAAVEAYRTGWR